MSPEKANQKTRRKKIVFMWNYLEWGGAQIYFLAIMKEAKKNWDIKVILPKNSSPDFLKYLAEIEVEYEFSDIKIELSPAYSVKEKINRQRKRIASEFKTYMFLSKYDLKNTVLHIETAPWQSWLLISALCKRVNVFVTMHNALPVNSRVKKIIWSKRLNFILGLKKFHLFVANENAKDSIKDLVTKENFEKIILTRASINPSEIEKVTKADFDRGRILEKHGIPKNKFLILCVGQFIDRKGRWIFLEAAKKILKSDDSVHFLWLTPIQPSSEDKKRIEQFDLGESFQIVLSETIGKNRADVLSFFRIADVFALPSLFEGLPIAVLEAMALGIPTISTNITAIPEAVKNYETGLLIEPNSSEALKTAIIELKENERLRANLSKNGRKFIIENFDEGKWAQIAVENYEKALVEK